mmetsp:Transcript_56434/g.131485  ORF Transcript_56434/g.131485 Transcript_56434/m.131485 type:complete len:232 (-) Transcript_56434:562-1257(-)
MPPDSVAPVEEEFKHQPLLWPCSSFCKCFHNTSIVSESRHLWLGLQCLCHKLQASLMFSSQQERHAKVVQKVRVAWLIMQTTLKGTSSLLGTVKLHEAVPKRIQSMWHVLVELQSVHQLRHGILKALQHHERETVIYVQCIDVEAPKTKRMPSENALKVSQRFRAATGLDQDLCDAVLCKRVGLVQVQSCMEVHQCFVKTASAVQDGAKLVACLCRLWIAQGVRAKQRRPV